MCGPPGVKKTRGFGSGRSLYDPNQNEVKTKLKRSAIVAEE